RAGADPLQSDEAHSGDCGAADELGPEGGGQAARRHVWLDAVVDEDAPGDGAAEEGDIHGTAGSTRCARILSVVSPWAGGGPSSGWTAAAQGVDGDRDHGAAQTSLASPGRSSPWPASSTAWRISEPPRGRRATIAMDLASAPPCPAPRPRAAARSGS